MTRRTMIRPVRLALVAALMGTLLAMTAGVVSAAVTITATPGSATASPVGGNTFDILYTTIAVSLDVNYAQNVSGEKTDLSLIGGGPYCFTLYSGTIHTTKIAGPTMVSIFPYLTYAGGGAANPTAGLDNAGGTLYFSSGNGATNALVCVHGNSIPSSDILHQTPFAYNSQGYGSKVASFQTVGAGVNKYTLHIGVGNFDASGNPTPASCQTGTTPSSAAFFVHTYSGLRNY